MAKLRANRQKYFVFTVQVLQDEICLTLARKLTHLPSHLRLSTSHSKLLPIPMWLDNFPLAYLPLVTFAA